MIQPYTKTRERFTGNEVKGAGHGQKWKGRLSHLPDRGVKKYPRGACPPMFLGVREQCSMGQPPATCSTALGASMKERLNVLFNFN